MPVVNIMPQGSVKIVKDENGNYVDIEYSNPELQKKHVETKARIAAETEERQANNQRKASLFALRKTGKSLGYSSSSVFGGGGSTKEINEIGVTLG